MGKDKNVGYAEALTEIENIITGLNDENMDIDLLGDKVKRAGELIKICRERLRKAEEDVAKLLGEE